MNRILVVCGHSKYIEPEDAANDLIRQCDEQLIPSQSEPKAGIIFFDYESNANAIVVTLLERWPHLALVGCSSCGEFSNVGGFTDGGVTLMLMGGDAISLSVVGIEQPSEHQQLPAHIASDIQKIHENNPIAACIMLGDVLCPDSNAESIMSQMLEILPEDTKLIGGMASTGWHTDSTQVLFKVPSENLVITQACFALLMICGDDIQCEMAISSGWRPYGKKSVATITRGNDIYRIDDQPPINFYRSSRQDLFQPRPQLPISVTNEVGDFLFMRGTLGETDPLTGAIHYFGNIPQHSVIQQATITRVSLIEDLTATLQELTSSFVEPNPAKVAICFSCDHRRKTMGLQTEKEVEIIQTHLPPGTAFSGFYTFGEIGSLNNDQQCQFHNHVFVCLLLG